MLQVFFRLLVAAIFASRPPDSIRCVADAEEKQSATEMATPALHPCSMDGKNARGSTRPDVRLRRRRRPSPPVRPFFNLYHVLHQVNFFYVGITLFQPMKLDAALVSSMRVLKKKVSSMLAGIKKN